MLKILLLILCGVISFVTYENFQTKVTETKSVHFESKPYGKAPEMDAKSAILPISFITGILILFREKVQK